MSIEPYKEKKESLLDRLKRLSDFLEGLPKTIAALLLILSLMGGAYSSFFKVESDARETYRVLAPEIDLSIEQSDANAANLEELRVKLEILEKEKDLLQQLMVGFLTAQGLIKAPVDVPPKVINIPLPNKPRDDIVEPPPRRVPDNNKRKRQEPHWKK